MQARARCSCATPASAAAGLSPKLVTHIQAVAFHAETGQLDLRPDSPAYATQLRLITSRIVAAANDAVGTQAIRTVQVLAVGATGPAHREAATAPAPAAAPEMPVKTREEASPGYHQALAAHRAVAPARRVDPAISEAVERQTRAMRELSRRPFPDPEPDPDDASASIDAVRIQRRRQATVTEAAALRRARAEKAGRSMAAPQQLERTA
ncbi:DciA family protein [Streptomyces lavendulocolor]|uniref:DciA family protein n=1 Tax=Streptomyces lavendulocolor TaxID=67316 RepID=UPI003C308CF0